MCNTNIYHNCNNHFNTNSIILFTFVGLTWLLSIIAIIILCYCEPKFIKSDSELELEIMNNENDSENDSDDDLLVV